METLYTNILIFVTGFLLSYYDVYGNIIRWLFPPKNDDDSYEYFYPVYERGTLYPKVLESGFIHFNGHEYTIKSVDDNELTLDLNNTPNGYEDFHDWYCKMFDESTGQFAMKKDYVKDLQLCETSTNKNYMLLACFITNLSDGDVTLSFDYMTEM